MGKKIGNEFFRLYNEAKSVDIKGWDFSYVKDRLISEVPPWDYQEIIVPYVKKSTYLLDMGTGGGEFLSELKPLPKHIFATEAYPPNIPIARKRLEKLGIKVIHVKEHSELPLKSEFFDLIINRHEDYDPMEVYRILKPNGTFITQQVGHYDSIELNQFFGDDSYKNEEAWDLKIASSQLKSNGFTIIKGEEALYEEHFKDIGAIVFYLRIISWQIPNFNFDLNIHK